jgi:flagellar biosynthesis GTPase FlhF
VIGEELSRAPLGAPAITAPLSLVNGVARLSPVLIDTNAASWQGVVTYDFKSLTLEARGLMASKANPPRNWTGTPPAVGLAWRGPLSNPAREIDPGPLTNGRASIVLQRELEKIEMFESDANERLRRQNRRDMDRQRERDRLAAEEAARQARQREEAEQRARAEAERLRIEAERRAAIERAVQERAAQERAAQERAAQERAAQERAAQERAALERAVQERAAQERSEQERASEQASRLPGNASQVLPPPLDIRPPAQTGRPGG